MARATTKSRQVGAGGRSNTRIRKSSAPRVVAPQPKPQNIVQGANL